jgi:hypothetical protein
MKTHIFLFLFVALMSSCANDTTSGSQYQAANYYLDATEGNDDNQGTSPGKAWKTLDKINSISLKAGDKIYLKRGETFAGELEINGKGAPNNRIVIDAYGEKKQNPCIAGLSSSLYAVCIYNSDYVTLKNIEIINTGVERLPRRTGVKILCDNYGISHNIILDSLYIHDVNGSLVKQEGGGSGIYIERISADVVSLYDSLIIQNCIIRRCERNAMIWSEGKGSNTNRNNWHPSLNTIVRNNLIEEVPGDGIVPIGCDGALIEYNIMRNCPETLPDTEAAAGFWPWSSDNTIIQYNEVSDHKAPWDAQGYDSDYNCTGTIIQYNYSHDNYGGMVLICNSGDTKYPANIGNLGAIVRYNISVNDGLRPKLTPRNKMFSPVIHIAGPVKNTLIERNILYQGNKSSPDIDRTMIASDSWGGYADSTAFRENVFHALEESCFDMTQSTHNFFEGNFYSGKFKQIPADENIRLHPDLLPSLLDGFNRLNSLTESRQIAGATGIFVNKTAIENFFGQILDN